MLLEVVSDSWNVGSDFHSVSKANSGDLSNGRVRLLRRGRRYLRADPSLERRRVERRVVLKGVESSSESNCL